MQPPQHPSTPLQFSPLCSHSPSPTHSFCTHLNISLSLSFLFHQVPAILSFLFGPLPRFLSQRGAGTLCHPTGTLLTNAYFAMAKYSLPHLPIIRRTHKYLNLLFVCVLCSCFMFVFVFFVFSVVFIGHSSCLLHLWDSCSNLSVPSCFSLTL